MTQDLSQYLESIRNNARLDTPNEPGVMSELEAHIEDKLHELTQAGMSEEEAARTCMGQMGSIKAVARQIYEAYSQGSWKQVLMASLPHFLFGLIFVLNWWHHPQWLSIVIILTLGIALYGWIHDKPAWVFPWLGYTMVPVIAVGLMLLYMPTGWSFMGLIVYFPLALWWMLRIIVQTTKKDWLLSTLMLLPMPLIIGWFMAISPSWKPGEASIERINAYAPWIGVSFLILALTIAAFIRLRQRWLRVSVLALSGLATLTMAAYLVRGNLSYAAFMVPALGLWVVLIVPPLLERQLKHGNIFTKKHQHIQGTGGLPTA